MQTILDHLKDYVWQKDFENYTDFLNMLREEKYGSFISNFKQYSEFLTDWMDSMKSTDPAFRKKASLVFSKWLIENTNQNPFD